MAVKGNYYSVISEAINDLAEHGFTSEERIAYWRRRIREAAEDFLGSSAAMEQALRDTLGAVYKRLIDSGKIVDYHPGISRFTLEKVKPHLRSELDRRILASAHLIKLNREQAIAKTLQRFSGWSTSIPAGGSEIVKKQKEKENIKKPLAQIKFEHRRVLIDQSHKLTAALNDILATDGGAIAAVWRHVHQAGYNGRPEHEKRDGKIFTIRDSWAAKQGLVRKGPNGYTDEIEQVGEFPFCRCTYRYLYNLRDLPDDYLTQKGKDKLSGAREKIASMTRADAQSGDKSEVSRLPLADVHEYDRLNYMKGVRAIRIVPDKDEWHASYDPNTREIDVQEKLLRKDYADQVHVLLHEAGHRGQDSDEETFNAFKSAHLNDVTLFVSIANPVHLADYQRTGKVDGLASEVFAESYARAALGLELPPPLQEFWRERFGHERR